MFTPGSVVPPEVKPSVVHLSDVLGWVRQGRLRPTRFQRPFRWDRSRVRDLFDSIRKQYPVGTLLVWVSTQARPTRPTLGPLALPDATGSVLLLIDGQQRISAIAGVLLRQKMAAADEIEDPGMWELWFDAEDDSFKYVDRDPVPASCIRVRDLLELRTIIKSTNELYQKLEAEENTPQAEESLFAKPPDRSISWRTKAQKIEESWQSTATALNSYRIPVVEFHTDNLTLAVESFARLNRRGLDISSDEMFSALAEDESQSKRLADHIDEILHHFKGTGYGELDRLTILRMILLWMDLDPFRTDWNRLNEAERTKTRKQIGEVVPPVQHAIERALKFLLEQCCLPTNRLLPYSGILVGVAAYLGNNPPLTADVEGRLKVWVWRAAFGGFAESNPSRATQTWKSLKALGKEVEHKELPGFSINAGILPFPLRHDLRSARLLASLWASMADQMGRNFNRLEQAGKLINLYGADCWRRILRGHREGSARMKVLLASPANRIFDEWGLDKLELSPSLGSRFILQHLDPSQLSLQHLDPSQPTAAQRHCITPKAYEALNLGKEELFLELRLEAMIERERAFLVSLGLTPPEERGAVLSPIDREAEDDIKDFEDTE